jgi:hypothetical protein
MKYSGDQNERHNEILRHLYEHHNEIGGQTGMIHFIEPLSIIHNGLQAVVWFLSLKW